MDSDNVAPPIPETLTENNKQRVDDEERAAVAASLTLLDSWQDLTGAFPRDEGEKREAVASLNRLWIRVGRDTHKAWKLLEQKRVELLKQNKTPYRPAAVVPLILAELDAPSTRASPSKAPDKKADHVQERMARVRALMEEP